MSSFYCNVSLKMVVRVFLVIACFVKIVVCNPYTSMLNSKFPAITTSYATNILPEDIPSCDSYHPSILLEMTYPTEDIRLNYPSVLSRPMAITPLPMPRDLSADVFIPEINFPNNGYAPGKSACHKKFKYDSTMPKLMNDIPTPKYQFKPFSESYNVYRENLLKNEPNLKSNAVIPQNTVFDDFVVIDNKNYLMYDLDDIPSPPLKIPLNPQQAPYELPIQKPLIDYNFNTYQDSLDGQEYIRNKNEIASLVFPGRSDIFFNQATSILNDGKFLEEEIQIPRTYTYNNNNPIDSSLFNQQLLLLNNFAVPEKQSKRTTDLNNLSNFDIDINIVDNTSNENIPIEITISDASDVLISTDNEEASCIIIDIYNENSETNECSTGQVKISESDAPPFQLASELEEVIDDTQKINSIGFESFSLKDFSTYLAESILSALQTYALQPISSNIKDNKANDTFTCADITAPLFNKPVSPCEPLISSQSHETPNIKTKSKDTMKANKTSQTPLILNNTKEKVKATSNTNNSKDVPTNETPQSLLPSNKDDKTSEPSSPTCACKISDKSIDITTNKTSLSSQSTNKASEVASNINASPITSKDMSKDKSSHISFPSNSINKTFEIASTINICPTKGKDIYTDKATQNVITSSSTNKTSEVESTTKTAPITNESEDISKNKAPQTSLSSDNKNKTSVPNITMDPYPISDKSKEISTDETKRTSLPPNNTGAMSESSTCTMTCTSSQTSLTQSDKVAAKPSHTKPQPCISTIKINISPLKDNLHQIVVFV